MAYVQGARRPGGAAIRDFDAQMFALGFHCTSGYRCSGSYHGCGPVPEGAASDYGDSVNDLREQWLIAWPHRHEMAEMLGPWGLYRWGKRFYHAQLQAQHRDHNHFALTQKITLAQPDTTPTLTHGDEGPAVKRAQGLMRDRGMLYVQADGVFGPATQDAARRLHRAYGHEAHAHIGPALWSILEGGHPWSVLLPGERAVLAELEARRRSARRNGGWDRIDASHLLAATRAKAALVARRKEIWRAAQKSGWSKVNRRRRYALLLDHTR